MKKIYFAAISIVGAFLFTSCVMSDLKKVTDEANEILSGNVFLIPTGQVEYTDGTVFIFADYGKRQKITKGTDIEIYDNKTWYSLDSETKTGYKYTYSGEYDYCTTYCFMENTYLVDSKYDEELKKGSQTIAGTKCNVYTESDGDKIGGWKRILFIDTYLEVEAKSFTEQIPSDPFSIEGYKITEN